MEDKKIIWMMQEFHKEVHRMLDMLVKEIFKDEQKRPHNSNDESEYD